MMFAITHKPRFRPGDLFTIFIILVLAAALIIASEWVLRASVLILVLGSVGLVVAIAQLIVDVFYRKPEAPRSGPQYDIPSFDEADSKLVSRGSLEMWAWLFGLLAIIPIVGMPVALCLFVLVYSKLYGASWLIAILLTLMIGGFIWGVYIQLMHVYWPDSILGRYIEGL